MNIKPYKSISLPYLIAGAIILSSITLTILNVFIVAKESRSAAISSAEALFAEITSRTINSINLWLEPISTITLTSSLTLRGDSALKGEEGLYKHLSYIKDVLDVNEDIMSAYIGYANGNFYQVIATRSNRHIMETYRAPTETKYIDRAITGGEQAQRRQRWRFFDSNMKLLSQRVEHDFKYDPRVRPWYEAALKQKDTVFTSPYIFSSSRLPGITCARLLKDGGGVFGLDFSLAQFSNILSSKKISDQGLLWVMDNKNRLVAAHGLYLSKQTTEDLSLPEAGKYPNDVIRAVSQKMSDKALSSSMGNFFVETKKDKYFVSLTSTSQKGLDLTIAVAVPSKDITGHIHEMAVHSIMSSFAFMSVIILLTILIIKRTSRMLSDIVKETDKIRSFDFSISPPIKSRISEFQSLISAIDVMKSTIHINTENLVNTQHKLEKLVQGAIALSSEKQTATLMTMIMDISKELSGADGGALYLVEGDLLEVELLSLRSGSIVLGGLSDNPTPRIMLRPQMMPFLDKASLLYWACRAYNDRTLIICNDSELILFPTGLPEEPRDYKINAMIAAPLITNQGKVLGIIQLFNPIDKDSHEYIDSRHENILNLIKSLASQAAVSIDNRNLMKSLKEIFDALIQVIASSIDAKSPYTGGHCTRVPEIVMMIARAAHDIQEGPLKDFRLDNEDSERELMIAAWLHDCGKVTTPDYVVDKATKLETVYNRIHEIRMRFEVLRRDAVIKYYTGLIEGNRNPEELKMEMDAQIKELEEDFAFVAQCNLGSEFMSEAHKERIRVIAERTWLRHFSDRAGLSEEEIRMKGDDPEPSLPVAERLLSDKPEHILPRTRKLEGLKDINGNPLYIPVNEYNRGEIYNLCILRGTLTEEERYKINEHALMSFQMLSKVPFPNGLKGVTEIAASHHETLVGTGYPFKKTKSDLSVQSRILAVADVFEALTARDRPYKKAKSLSEALKIMTFMRKDGHIDPDIFDVFLKSGVYKNYAERHLLASQIDVEDITPYLSSEPPMSQVGKKENENRDQWKYLSV